MFALAIVHPAWAGDPPSVSASYVTDVIGNASGGVERGVDWIGRLDLVVASGDRLFGIDGAHAQFDMMLLHGGGFSAVRTGDGQVLDNIDAPHAVRPFEAWISVPLTPRLRAKAGLVDLNSEFDQQNVGALFLNSSFGIAPDYSQSGLNGPSIFPVTSPGLVIAIEKSRWTLRTAIFDAEPGDPAHPHRTLPGPFFRDGGLLASEGEVKVGSGGELQIGAWLYTTRFDRLDGRGRSRSAGAYVQYEQTFIGNDRTGALRGWVRAGRAAAKVNEIGTYVGGGLCWGTDGRSYGIAVAHARLGDPGVQALSTPLRPHRAETAIELTATRKVSRWLTLQPDMQYVRHPGWRGTPDALVLGLRLRFTAR